MNRIDNILNAGVARKRAGDLKGAKEIYIEALKLDPYYPMTYISIGKVCYLLREQSISFMAYLASMHLQIYTREQRLQGKIISSDPMADIMDNMNEEQYNSLSPQIKKILPRKSGLVILQGPNTPRHIAHTLFDLDERALNQNNNVAVFSQIYRAQLAGNNTYESKLMSLGKTESEYNDFDEEFYSTHGKFILLDNIKWDKIESREVLDIYFQ